MLSAICKTGHIKANIIYDTGLTLLHLAKKTIQLIKVRDEVNIKRHRILDKQLIVCMILSNQMYTGLFCILTLLSFMDSLL